MVVLEFHAATVAEEFARCHEVRRSPLVAPLAHRRLVYDNGHRFLRPWPAVVADENIAASAIKLPRHGLLRKVELISEASC